MEELSDERLVGSARGGDVAAFTVLARRYQNRIYGMIMGMTRNHQDADDLAQETFLQAFRALDGFRGRSSFYTWIYRIAVNLTLNFLKKAGREKNRAVIELDAFAEGLDEQKKSSSPEKSSLRREFRKSLKEAIDALPLVYRSAFVMVEYQGMSHRQASEVLKCSENTVSWRMHKARKMLQTSLKPYWERGVL